MMLSKPDAILLPPPVGEERRLVELIGAPAALALIEARGGTRLYIAKHPETLADLVGAAAADKLAGAFGGEWLRVPLARRWRVLVYGARGWSQAKVARAVGCTEHAVQRIMARNRQPAPQLDFFAR